MNAAIAWFTRNSVAANLLLLIIVAGGLSTAPRIKQEVFPEVTTDMITVAVEYPGAAPEEVEEGVCVRIEEQIYGLDGIRRLKSSAREGVGVVTAELELGADARRVLDDIKARVDAINTFPQETEKPLIQEVVLRQQVLNVAVSGDVDETALKAIGQRVRDEITALPAITVAELVTARPYEISIEVSEDALRRHGLTFDDVAQAVRRTSLDLPGGSIKTAGGEVLLRTKGQAYRGNEFERLVLLSRADGTRLTLGDVARVDDGFAETDQSARFDGKPAVMIQVFRVGDQHALEVAAAVKEYIAGARVHLPSGVTLTVWDDDSEHLRSRMQTLLRNGRDGFLLVLLVLALFLRFGLAFWIIVGVPVSFVGALWAMPTLGVSINIISLFAFIVVLGILVDDGIVVGENIYSLLQEDKDPVEAAIRGAQEVAVPVAFGVFTTIAAFVPMLMVAGVMGKFTRVIPLIVIATLIVSLVESLFVLPSHLAHSIREPKQVRERANAFVRWWRRVQAVVAGGLEWFIARVYRPSLEWALEWRYLTLSSAVAAFLISLALLLGGWIKFAFFPEVEGTRVIGRIEMPAGTPVERTAIGIGRLEQAAASLLQELEVEEGKPIARHVMVSIGEQPFRSRQSGRNGGQSTFTGSNLGEVTVELVPSEERDLLAEDFAHRWRDAAGPIADAVEVQFSSAFLSSGEPINVQLRGPDLAALESAAGRLKEHLAQYEGVLDIADSFRSGKQEIKLDILPSAEMLGLTLADLGRQVRQAFYGEEAQRVQRGRDEVKVMVRYPAERRRSLSDIEGMRIRTPKGAEVPFTSVARADFGRGFSTIERTERRRVINVTANLDLAIANANEIIADLRKTILPQLVGDYRGLSYEFEGEQREQRETLAGLGRGYLLALLLIFALLAVPLGSYVQPLIIMTAIPFGLIGAVWGHVLMGYNLSMFSIIGIVALAGVVVNDSLVLVSYINRRREDGVPLAQTIREAGVKRFRPILLTSVTTFAGLTPLMLETSIQAQMMIPMAISLGFGVIFATAISLLMVPANYLILDDAASLIDRWRGRAPEAPTEAPVERTESAPLRIVADKSKDRIASGQ